MIKDFLELVMKSKKIRRYRTIMGTKTVKREAFSHPVQIKPFNLKA